jgi:uncharacterized protein
MSSRTQDLIHEMTQVIVREVDPTKVILFGSWARGTATTDSDVDLLIVERESFGPLRSRRQEATRIWRCLAGFRVPKDILVYTEDELNQKKDSVNHVLAQALREGKVLYESS